MRRELHTILTKNPETNLTNHAYGFENCFRIFIFKEFMLEKYGK